MFETPTRNHFSIVFERAGAVIAMLLAFAYKHLQDVGWDIFRPSYYKALIAAQLTPGRSLLFGGAGLVAMLWYLYISVRYWKRTTFYIDGVDFVYERKTMFRAASRLPIQNIAVVNVERNIFERLIGTAKVKIDLNSSRTAGSTDFKFVLRDAQAQQLRDTLMRIKQELTAAEQAAKPETQTAEAPEEPRQRVAYFSTAQALLHKLLFLPVIQSAAAITMMFILPQLEITGMRDMSRMWFLLLVAGVGWVASVVNGTLNLGNYTVERDSRMVYIHCGVLNQRHYVFEIEKINAVMIRQPLLARFFGMASVDLAVVGFGNEKNETTHLSLAADLAQVQKILEMCVPDFLCTVQPRRGHPVHLLLTMLRAAGIGAGVWLVLNTMYRGAWIIAAIAFAVAVAGSVSEYLMRDFAADEQVVRYTSGIYNRRTSIVKYGDIQEMRVRTNIFLRPLGLGSLRFSILASSTSRDHKTALMPAALFDAPVQQMVAHEDSILLAKYKR